MNSLKFSIFQNQYVEIKNTIDNKKIDNFFENKFYLTFNREKTYIGLSDFFKKKDAVMNFLIIENINSPIYC